MGGYGDGANDRLYILYVSICIPFVYIAYIIESYVYEICICIQKGQIILIRRALTSFLW